MKRKDFYHMLKCKFHALCHLIKPYKVPEANEMKKEITKAQGVLQIRGKVLPEKETVMTSELVGYTKTKVRVQKVYKGNYKIDEIIEICEPYYEGHYQGEKCLIIHENYTPLHIGGSYIFLLTKEKEMLAALKQVELKANKAKMQTSLLGQVS